jgi:ABC-2 type transport system permease protein
LVFVIIEVILLILLLRPPLFLQTNLATLLAFIVASLLAMLLYFYFSFLISMTTFWLPEENGWPQRFVVFMLMEFFAGGLFPLDILPARIYQVIQFLPTTYFLNAPMQIYLGRATGSNLALIFTMMIFWLFTLSWLANWVFRKGLKIYGAYGR